MKFKVSRLKQNELLIQYILIVDFSVGLISSFIPVAHSLFYTIDLANILLLVNLFYKGNYKKLFTGLVKPLTIWSFAFFSYALIISILNLKSLMLFLWAIRNNFRYFVFFFSCVLWVKGGIKLFERLTWINFLAVMFEFLIMGKRQDWIGGIFGFIGGDVNAPLNIFLIVITTNSIICYLNKKESLQSFLLKSASSFIISAIAELKIFYIEYAMIIIFALLITNFTLKKVLVILVFIIGALISIRMLYIVIPELDPDFFTITHMYRYVTSSQGYTSTGDMNRFTFIGQCNELLKTGRYILTGLGLGNCEVATNIGWYSEFYKLYAYTHYNWMSSSFIYLELGLIGMALYFCFFIIVFIQIRKKQQTIVDKTKCQVCSIIALISIVLILYNSSMRGNYGYLVYYVLSLPFVSDKRKVMLKGEKYDS